MEKLRAVATQPSIVRCSIKEIRTSPFHPYGGPRDWAATFPSCHEGPNCRLSCINTSAARLVNFLWAPDSSGCDQVQHTFSLHIVFFARCNLCRDATTSGVRSLNRHFTRAANGSGHSLTLMSASSVWSSIFTFFSLQGWFHLFQVEVWPVMVMPHNPAVASVLHRNLFKNLSRRK